jgi:hypothetical protein
MDRVVRCPACMEQFAESYILDLDACPFCASKAMIQYPENDVTLNINWDDLRLLANCAQSYCDDQISDEPEIHEEIELILSKLRSLQPPGGDPLTLKDMLAQLREKGVRVDNLVTVNASSTERRTTEEALQAGTLFQKNPEQKYMN